MAARTQRRLLRAGAVIELATIFALLFAISDPVQAGAVLFVVPVAMLALSDGARGGLAGAAVATALIAIWVLGDGIPLNVLGWGSRITAVVTIGLLVGRYEDLARAQERQRLDERYATELHDRVVQALVVARYRLDDRPEAQEAVDAALAGAKEIISTRLGQVAPGRLRMHEPHPAVPPQRDR
jgi:K+-sensing histidine kinase KdpD